MIKTFTLVTLFVAIFALSAAMKQSEIAQILYPTNIENQEFTSKFFDIVELHKSQDPLLEGKGPSVVNYSLDKIKFAFIANETDLTADLVFFNWTLPVFGGLMESPELSRAYGSTVYVLRGINKKLVATQGENNDELTNFSYVFGSGYMEAQIKNGNPDMQVPQELLDWKPHPDAMDRNHPLRKTLGTQVLTLLSPDKETFFKQARVTESTRGPYEAYLETRGGFKNVIMGMMVHEMYHVKEGEDGVNGLAVKRVIAEDRKALVAQLQSDTSLRDLYGTYAKIIFSIGDSLKTDNPSPKELEKLSDLNLVVSHIQANYSNAWSFIWDYEYTEGFAEYVSAYSMIQVGVTSFSEQIDLQKSDSNNFAYRTGAIGGLYLATRLKELPFDNQEDHRKSIWELVLDRVELPSSTSSLEDIKEKYASYDLDVDTEIGLVTDYC